MNPRQVKARLDRAGLISNEGCLTSVNQYGCKSVRTIKMTYFEEANLFPLHLPELLRFKNPRDVKKRLDSRGLHTMDVSTNSKNRHGEFTRITTMTYIDEAYLYRCIFQSLLRFKNPRGRKETTRFWGRRYNRHPLQPAKTDTVSSP